MPDFYLIEKCGLEDLHERLSAYKRAVEAVTREYYLGLVACYCAWLIDKASLVHKQAMQREVIVLMLLLLILLTSLLH